jgi:mono/diheme cytochrome c family protein
MIRELKLVAIVAAITFVTAACASSPSAKNEPVSRTSGTLESDTVPSTNASKTLTDGLNGHELYAENCMICHRKTATGGAATIQGKKIKPADLTKDRLRTWPDDKWLRDVEAGDPDEGMPAFRDKLSPEQIIAIVNYIRTL